MTNKVYFEGVMTSYDHIKRSRMILKEDFYSLQEIAVLLKLGESTIRRIVIYRNEMPYYRVGRQVRVKKEDLERYLTEAKNHGSD